LINIPLSPRFVNSPPEKFRAPAASEYGGERQKYAIIAAASDAEYSVRSETVKKRYQAAIFDLDGTLLNTLGDLCDAVNCALERLDLPKRSEEEVREFVGNGVGRLIELAVPEGTAGEVESECLAAFRERYEAHMLDRTAPYPGVIELLTKLRALGVKRCVISNKFDEAVSQLCERFFSGLVDFSVGESPATRRKPAPDSALRAIELMGVPADRTLYIGDSEVDGATAKAAGVDYVGVSWGFRSRETILESGAMTVVDSPDELLRYFE